MSNFNMEPVCCSVCGTEEKIKIWEDIDGNTSKRAKEEILAGVFFRHVCKKCGNITHLTYNCLYHDEEKQLLV